MFFFFKIHHLTSSTYSHFQSPIAMAHAGSLLSWASCKRVTLSNHPFVHFATNHHQPIATGTRKSLLKAFFLTKSSHSEAHEAQPLLFVDGRRKASTQP